MVISNQSCCLTDDQPISGLKVCIVDNHNCKTTNQHKPSGNKLINNHILRGWLNLEQSLGRSNKVLVKLNNNWVNLTSPRSTNIN